MLIKVIEKATGKEVKAPQGSYRDSTEGLVIGLDGKIYTLDDNSACGDPDCCGPIMYYYKDVSHQYELIIS